MHCTSDQWGTSRLCLNFHARSYFVQACQCTERTGPPKIVRFLLRKLQKLQYSQLYRLIAQASTHLLGTTPVGVSVTSSEQLGPVERSNGRIAVLARRPPENREVFCDFVASRGREGPPSILATSPTRPSVPRNEARRSRPAASRASSYASGRFDYHTKFSI